MKSSKQVKAAQSAKRPQSTQTKGSPKPWNFTKAARFSICSSLLLGLFSAGMAHATPVPIPDFSFENVITGPGGAVGGSGGVLLGTAPNWNSAGNAGNGIQSVTNGDTFFNAATLPAPGDGTNYFYANMLTTGGVTDQCYCWQDIGPLQSNTIYTLTIAVGETLSAETGVGFIGLVNGQSPFQTILATTPIDTTSYTAGTFSNVTVVYTTGAKVSGDLTVLMQGNSGQQIVFDNVRLDASPAANPTALLPVTESATTSNSVFTGSVLAQETNTVYLGNALTLSEDAAGTAPFTYQWLTDNGSGGVTFTPVTGGTNSTLAVNTSGFTPNSPVEYEVKVTTGSTTSTSPPVMITAITGPPVIYVDTLPTLASDFVGDSMKFSATFLGSSPMSFQWFADYGGGPVAIPGATNETLVLTNLQLTNAGNYTLTASNQFSVVSSDIGALAVTDPTTNTTDNVVIATAFQDGLGTNTLFTPSWILPTNSLIAGASPFAATPSLAAFQYGASGGAPVLTDGSPGTMPPAGNTSSALAAAGTSPTGASIYYLLPTNGAPYGWTITNITVYGGWADAGRIEQEYNLFYSPNATPTNFSSPINAGGAYGGNASVDFQYPGPNSIDPNAVQCATRVTITASTNTGLAQNAAGIELFFDILAKGPENGWCGYGEIQVFGTPSAPAIQLLSNTTPAIAADMVGSSVTFYTLFSAPSSLAYQWMVDTGGGPVVIPGATNTVLTLNNLQQSDTGSYSCLASNSTGTSLSSPASLTVNPDAGPDADGAIDLYAFQANSGQFFYPTWTLPPGDLLSNLPPSAVAGGQFGLETCSGVTVLTDGVIGGIGGGNDVFMASCGPGAGTTVYYLLPTGSAPNGYDLTNIQIFGGWNDQGRDENECAIYYSTPIAPTQFTNPVAIYDYPKPISTAIPTMTRVSVSGSAGILASNVVGIEVSFYAGENNWEGYSEIAAYGVASTNVVTGYLALARDIIPFNGADVAGSSETFTTVFSSSLPISYQWYTVTNGINTPVAGGTSANLTLNNLQTNESGSYYVVASNALGTVSCSTNTFVVNPTPTATNGIVEDFAFQQTYNGGPEMAPTWTLPAGDLLLGLTATSLTPSATAFAQGGCGPAANMTDGAIGYVGGTIHELCSAGTSEGTSATYKLPPSASGYNISQIITYGGWQDTGRDWQNYTLYYATAASPNTYTTLASVVYKVSTVANSGIPNMSRVTIAPATGGYLASNVVSVFFNFTTPTGQENGWQGYSELAAYGQQELGFTKSSISGGNLVLAGGGGTAGSNYTILSATNLLGPWVTNTTGTFNGSGSFSNAIPIIPSVHGEFFILQVP